MGLRPASGAMRVCGSGFPHSPKMCDVGASSSLTRECDCPWPYAVGFCGRLLADLDSLLHNVFFNRVDG